MKQSVTLHLKSSIFTRIGCQTREQAETMWSRYFSHQETRDVVEGLLAVEVNIIHKSNDKYSHLIYIYIHMYLLHF